MWILPLSAYSYVPDQSQDELFDIDALLLELDQLLEMSPRYDTLRLDRIASIKAGLANPILSERYRINQLLIEEYKSFQLDSALVYINANMALAREMNSLDRLNETRIDLAFIYATSGYYLEAVDETEKIDRSLLTRKSLREYYQLKYRLNRELYEYTRDYDNRVRYRTEYSLYRDTLLSILDPQSDSYLSLQGDIFMEEQEHEQADSVYDILLSRFSPRSHEYAINAYMRQLNIDLSQDRWLSPEQRLNRRQAWLIRSAKADYYSAIKDNASLCVLANVRYFDTNDVDRSFRYICHAMEDAIYFNARLRPWQVAGVLSIVENDYQVKQELETLSARRNAVIIGIVTLFLLAASLILLRQQRRLRRMQADLQEANSQMIVQNGDLVEINSNLKELNDRIVEANRVKEEFVAVSLTTWSDYIEKLRAYQRNVRQKLAGNKVSELVTEVNRSTMIEEEVQEFYRMFDTVFLELYPDFVDAFNSLLEEDGRIVIKKGELLPTELRIFALIRLGITDSSKIAALLRYSVNTIYNYRARIKSKALIKEDFEEQIKRIGSFRL